MMSRLCLLAIVLCLPFGCLGGDIAGFSPSCSAEFDRVGRPQEGVTNYRAYRYDDMIVGDCDNLELTCEATITDGNRLRGRTWFITNIRPNYGLFYDNQTFHDFRVQCPPNTVLHLFVQNSDLSQPGQTACGGNNIDVVRVAATGLGTNDEVLFCGDNNDVQTTDLYNLGRGRMIPDGRANITFCTNNLNEPGGPFEGFVMRATCLDLPQFMYPGCVDLNFFRAWDPGFVNQIFSPGIGPVERVLLPHKRRRRSVSDVTLAMKRLLRKKKFTTQEKLELMSGDMVMYNSQKLTITINATGETIELPDEYKTVLAFNFVIGTREFNGSAPFTFFGPGELVYDRSFAKLTSYTISLEMDGDAFLPGAAESEYANEIYKHIYENWIYPYPVVDNIERRGPGAPPILPLPPGNMPPLFPDLDIDGYRSVDQLGFLQEDIQSGSPSDHGNCMRAIRVEAAPSSKARVPPEFVNFCLFFYHACDLSLRTACQELLRLDPLSVGK